MSPVKSGSLASISARGRPPVALRDRLPLGVVGVGLGAEADREAVLLAALDREGDGLGRLAEGDRKDAGRERIERAGMSRLRRLVEALHARNGLRRGHPRGLVEDEPAIDRKSFAPRHRRLAGSRLVVEVAGDLGPRQQLIDAGCRLERGVHLEPELRHELHVDALGQDPAQEALVLLEMIDRFFGLAAAERHHIGRGELEVGRHAHFGHGERVPVQHLVHDLAAGEDLGERMPDHLSHLQLTLRGRLARGFPAFVVMAHSAVVASQRHSRESGTYPSCDEATNLVV